MAGFTFTVPKQYQARLGGKAKVSIEAASEHAAQSQLVQYGIPYAATNSFPVERTVLKQGGVPIWSVGGQTMMTGEGPRIPSGSTFLSDIKKKSGPSLVDSGVVRTRFENAMSGFDPGGWEVSGTNFDPTAGGTRLTPADFARIREQAETDRIRRESISNQIPEFDIDVGSTGNSAVDINTQVANQTGGVGDLFAFEENTLELNRVEKPRDTEYKREVTPRTFQQIIAAIDSGGISLFSGGTFDLTPFESPEFWDTVFEQPTRDGLNQLILDDPMATFGATGESQQADRQQSRLDAIVQQIIAIQPSAFEGKKAVAEFYEQAALQAGDRGLSNLTTSNGRTISQNITAKREPKKVEELVKQFEADPDAFNLDLDLQLKDAGGGSTSVLDDVGVNDFGIDDRFDPVFGAVGGEGEGFFGDSFNPYPNGKTTKGFDTSLPSSDGQEVGGQGVGGQNGLVAIQDIIDNFERMNPGQKTTYNIPILDGAGDPIPNQFQTIVNPLLESLLDSAALGNGFVNQQTLSAAQNTTAVAVAQLQKDEAVAVAYQQGVSAADIATIQREGDYNIAIAQQTVDKHIANQQLVGTQAQATATETAALNMATGQTDAAKYAAGAASPFGFMQQAVDRENALGEVVTPEDQLESIYGQLNEVGLADAAARQSQADAANLAARNNAFSFAAGQEQFSPNQIAQIAANSPAAFAARGQVDAAQAQAQAQIDIARIQSSVGLDQNQKDYLIAQVNSDAQRAVASMQMGGQLGAAQAAAGGQEAAARAGATGFGALLSGDTGVNQQANEILRAQAANNPYAMQQLGQGWAGTGAADQNLRIDQILRGGLSPEQRLAEINASQSGQNFANQLNFMSNPSAIGFATETGLLNDISNSPEGNIPGSLFGFNSPSAAGAGGGQTTNTGNFNANTLRNASDEQIGFLQGAAAAGGQTPSEFEQEVQSFTPQGVGY